MHSMDRLVKLSFILCALHVAFAIEPPTVQTHSGLVAGQRLQVGAKLVDAFYGIPYATPPVGELRFEKPCEVKPWQGVYNATTKTTACWQTDFDLLRNVTLKYDEATEDCLHLNVWRPSGICDGETSCRKKNLSVLVFIHGGGFQWGDAGLFIYDAANFVALSDVVYVTFNHRLGALGFFPPPGEDKSGNMGFYDQLSVLRWVRRNIAHFGGNPEDVTLAGQSAGAMAVGLHSISPASRGLFKRAILQSGTPLALIIAKAFPGSLLFRQNAARLGCLDVDAEVRMTVPETLECLRRLDAKAIYNTIGGQSIQNQLFAPHFGDEFIPEELLSADNWKNIHVEEVLLGNNCEEGAVFVDAIRKSLPELESALSEDYRKGMVITLFVVLEIPFDKAEVIVEEYFGGPEVKHDEESAFEIVGQLVSDVLFHCPAHFFATAVAADGVTAYMYRFEHKPSYSTWPKGYGPVHADEIPFTIGTLPFFSDESRFTPPVTAETREFAKSVKIPDDEYSFMRQVVGVWSSFTKKGKLHIPTTNETWPKYSGDHPELVTMKPKSFKRTKLSKPCHLFKPYLVKE